jgi:hypothetical protein
MRMLPHGRRSLGVISLVVALGATATAYIASPNVASPAASSSEALFVAENHAAMNKMMARMEVKPSGDVDKDFGAMMIPHNQGAIDMAQAELRHGRNEQLRRIAQEIIIDQQQEIAAMRLALEQSLPFSVAAPDQPLDLLASAAVPTSTLPTICRGGRK